MPKVLPFPARPMQEPAPPVFVSSLAQDWRVFWPVLLLVVIGVLLRASYVQWTYFVNYQNKVFGQGGDNAQKSPAAGNESEVHTGDQERASG